MSEVSGRPTTTRSTQATGTTRAAMKKRLAHSNPAWLLAWQVTSRSRARTSTRWLDGARSRSARKEATASPRHVGGVRQERAEEADTAQLDGEPEAVVLSAPHVHEVAVGWRRGGSSGRAAPGQATCWSCRRAPVRC